MPPDLAGCRVMDDGGNRGISCTIAAVFAATGAEVPIRVRGADGFAVVRDGFVRQGACAASRDFADAGTVTTHVADAVLPYRSRGRASASPSRARLGLRE